MFCLLGRHSLEPRLFELRMTAPLFVKIVAGANFVTVARDLSGFALWDKPLEQGL